MDLPKIALFGYGYWGKKIANILKNYSDFVVVDPFITDRPKNIQIVTLADICASDQVIGCIIATPEGTHFELADQLLKAGKHVWVEKPLCLTAHQSEKIISTAQKMNKILFVDTIFLFDPLAWLVADWIGKQASTILTWKSSRLSDRKSQLELQPIDDLAIHDSYLLRWWFKDYKIEECTMHEESHQLQTIQMNINSPEGAKIACTWRYSFENTTSTRMLELATSDGTLVWEKQNGREALIVKDHTVTIHSHEVTLATALNRAIESFLLLLQHSSTDSTASFFNENCLNTKLFSMIYSSELVFQDIDILETIRDAKKATA
jgi:predicted dehydrogenase